MSFLEKLQTRWKLKSLGQVVLVLIVFACTGTTVLYLKAPLFWLLGITEKTDVVWRTVIYVVAILPVYQVLLLMYGFIFGQFQFFWDFEKKMLKRMGLLK
ncbi:MAG: hypothetical protein EAZ95_10615 [Bacteroidetes bacterium]|nr:MAG: hypothetical protein EAZ95_10615 [Bacteroidota bacterium]